MTTPQWKVAALGALGGAAIAVAIVFGSALLGAFPQAPLDGRQVRAYLLSHPQILAELTDRLQDEQADAADQAQQAALRAIGLKAFFDPKVAFVSGPADAKATIVEFFDYNCVHCRNALPAVKAYYAAHRGDTRFAFIDFPIFGDMSTLAARAAIAARRQGDKYIAFSFAMMGEKSAITPDIIKADAVAAGLDLDKLNADMKDPAVDATIVAAHDLATRLKVDGTPTFIFNGRVRAGEVDEAALHDIMAGKDI
jgi:protein-disulfide isomerase